MRTKLRLLRKLWWLNSNARLDRSELLELRERLFRDLLRHAWDETEFYPEFYREHGIERDDLSDVAVDEIPPVDKEMYRENFDGFSSDARVT